MGYQFVHIQGHPQARSGKAKSGGGARPISEILAEVTRQPGNCGHVSDPLEPILVFGFDAPGLEHRITSDLAKVKQAQGRAVRKDQRVLMSMVASHPTPMASLTSEQGQEAVGAWTASTIQWAREWAAARGGELVSVMAHADEEYPHLHLYFLPSVQMGLKADRMHPGRAAQAAAVAAAEAQGMDKKTALREGDRAYRAAMRAFQDDYYTKVGVEHGLTRIGPGRERLSREQWQEKKAAAKQTAEIIKSIDEVKAASLDEVNQKNRQLDIELKAVREEKIALYKERSRLTSMLAEINSNYAGALKVFRHFSSEVFSLLDKIGNLLPQGIRFKIKEAMGSLENSCHVLEDIGQSLETERKAAESDSLLRGLLDDSGPGPAREKSDLW